MSNKNVIKLIISILIFILGIWTESLLPFLLIGLIADSARRKPFYVILWQKLKGLFGRWFKWFEWFLASTLAVCFVFFIQTNIVGLYTFQTSSMHETLQVGDVLLVNKLIPGVRHDEGSIKTYHRSKGYAEITYKDIIVFNFPEGDSLLKNRPTESYYYLKRLYGDNNFSLKEGLQYHKVKDRPRFIKRVFGLPGDSIVIGNGLFYANNKLVSYSENSIDRYIVEKESAVMLKSKGVLPYTEHVKDGVLSWELKQKDYDVIKDDVKGIKADYMLKNFPDPMVFPFNIHLLWNMHHMGPIYIPQRGDVIQLTSKNIEFYKRIIETFEENELTIKGEEIWLNGKKVTDYVFKMDYYWVQGDNRPHSFDSRFWGFVPENHIIGKVEKVLFSRDLNKKGWLYFRKNRFLLDVE